MDDTVSQQVYPIQSKVSRTGEGFLRGRKHMFLNVAWSQTPHELTYCFPLPGGDHKELFSDDLTVFWQEVGNMTYYGGDELVHTWQSCF